MDDVVVSVDDEVLLLLDGEDDEDELDGVDEDELDDEDGEVEDVSLLVLLLVPDAPMLEVLGLAAVLELELGDVVLLLLGEVVPAGLLLVLGAEPADGLVVGLLL